MSSSRVSLLVSGLLMSSIFSAQSLYACASCGCAVENDWNSQDFSLSQGLKIDFKYDYLNQSDLFSGIHSISPVAASQVSNNGNAQEVEKYTTSRIYTTSFDYSNYDWGINIQVPYIVRDHSTLGSASDGITPGAGGGQYDSSTSSLGDIKIVGRYNGLTQFHNFGLLFGVKLATGDYKKTGSSTDVTSPEAVAIDRGLQPGTGTTDLIIGAFYHAMLSQKIDSFYQFSYQSALNSVDQYRPGDSLNLNTGLSYIYSEYFIPKIQLNYRNIQKDSGIEADQYSTGGELIYVSPGITVNLQKNLSVYGYIQLPIYRNLNGVQLVPKSIESFGIQYRF